MEARGVTALGAILSAREERADNIARALEGSAARGTGVSVACLSLVSPGPEKSSPVKSRARDAALDYFLAYSRRSGIAIQASDRHESVAGPYAIVVAGCSPIDLKKAAVHIEESMAWGRILDIDVYGPALRNERPDFAPSPMRREDAESKPRACLLCSREAFACMRMHTHTSDELAAEADRLVGLLLRESVNA